MPGTGLSAGMMRDEQMRLVTWIWLFVALAFAVVAVAGEDWVTDRRPASTLMLPTHAANGPFPPPVHLRQPLKAD